MSIPILPDLLAPPVRVPDRLARLLGVYVPQQDTTLLGDVVASETRAGERVVDVCTGSGALAVRAARCSGTTVTALDISRAATLVTRWTAWRSGVRVRALRGDLFAPVAGERFDLVVVNPPYVPARDAAPPRRGRRRAWDGGTDGRATVDRICREVPALLAPAGRLLLVHSALTGVDATAALLAEQGLTVEVAARCEHPFGPVLSRRAHHLEQAGLIDAGERAEELVVLRARA